MATMLVPNAHEAKNNNVNILTAHATFDFVPVGLRSEARSTIQQLGSLSIPGRKTWTPALMVAIGFI